MSALNKISNSLEHTLKNSDLQKVTISLTEVFTDSLMENGIAKDIPIIGTIIGLGKTTMSIRENLFLKKIIYFISEIKNIPATKRREMIDKIDDSDKFRTKVGEKLLFIIDNCDDHEKSQIIARLFSAFLLGTIDYGDFLRASHIVDHVMNDDLKWFIESGWENGDNWKYNDHPNYEHGYLKIDDVGNIATSGLVEIISPEVSVRDQDDWKMDTPYIVEGSELSVRITDIGYLIKDILKDFFN